MSRELLNMPELACECIDRWLSEPRLFLQRFTQRMRDKHSKIEILDPDIRRQLIHLLLDQTDCCRRLERRNTGEHFVEHDAQAVDIGLYGCVFAAALFR